MGNSENERMHVQGVLFLSIEEDNLVEDLEISSLRSMINNMKKIGGDYAY